MSTQKTGRRVSARASVRQTASVEPEGVPIVEAMPRPKVPDCAVFDDGNEVVIGSRSKPRPAYRVAWGAGVVHDCYPPEGGELALDDVIAFSLALFHDEPISPLEGQDYTVWKAWRIAAVLIALPDGRVEVIITEGRRRETRYYEPGPKWEG